MISEMVRQRKASLSGSTNSIIENEVQKPSGDQPNDQTWLAVKPVQQASQRDGLPNGNKG